MSGTATRKQPGREKVVWLKKYFFLIIDLLSVKTMIPRKYQISSYWSSQAIYEFKHERIGSSQKYFCQGRLQVFTSEELGVRPPPVAGYKLTLGWDGIEGSISTPRTV